MNVAGLIVIGAGLFLIVVALRNTQSQVFPFFFSNGSGSSSGTGGSGILGMGCPSGYHPVTVLGVQWCFSNIIPNSSQTGPGQSSSNMIIPMPTGNSFNNANGTGA